MKSLYLDCETGISGDMIVAMLLDLGAEEQVLLKALAGIKEEGFSVKIDRVMKAGIDCCDFAVILDEAHENHDHDMNYLYGHEVGQTENISGHRQCESHVHAEHIHEDHHGVQAEHKHEKHELGEYIHGEHHTGQLHEEHDHGEHHEEQSHEEHDHGEHHEEQSHEEHDHGEHHAGQSHEEHDHGEHHAGQPHEEHDHGEHHAGQFHGGHDHGHHHIHRNYVDVVDMIEHLDMTDRAKMIAKKTFRILAEAEAKAHRRKIEEVHFHEVGAIDSIVDIVAAAVCFDNLDISQVIVRRICEGQGSVRCQHGILPVPVPAVINIAEKYGLPISITNRQGELVTPTGAAFVAVVMTGTELPEIMIPQKTGMGAGKRAYSRPSILRGMLFESEEKEERDTIWKLETNIDDCTGEKLGFVMERLMTAGARDVYYTPVYMKKNRPAWLLSVITENSKISEMEDIIFTHTTTIGIRRQEMQRTILPRKLEEVQTKYGLMQVKVCRHGDREYIYPEYERAAELAGEAGVSLGEIYEDTMKHVQE